MARDPAQLPAARRLSGLLIEVAERAKADFSQIAGEFGLTPVQARTLLWLGTPSAMGDLAVHLSCDPSNVTGIADRMEVRGLVARVPGEDRRVKQLELTEEGERLRSELAGRVAAGSTVTARLDSSEQDQLAGLLEKLLEDRPGAAGAGDG